MTRYEYKVVPAPTKGTKAKGIKTPQGRFARSVEAVLNQMGADGWEYLRAELLPSDERAGLTGTTTNWRNVLVFRRALTEDTGNAEPRLVAVTAADDLLAADDNVPVAPPVYSRSGFQPADPDVSEPETPDAGKVAETGSETEPAEPRP